MLIAYLLFFMVLSPFEYVPRFSNLYRVYCVYSCVSFFFCQHYAHEQYVVPCSSTQLFSLFYSIPLFKYFNVYFHFTMDGQLGFFQFGVVTHNTDEHIFLHAF